MSSDTPVDRSVPIQHVGRVRRRQRHVPRDLDRVRAAEIFVRGMTQSSSQTIDAVECDTDDTAAASRSERVGCVGCVDLVVVRGGDVGRMQPELEHSG